MILMGKEGGRYGGREGRREGGNTTPSTGSGSGTEKEVRGKCPVISSQMFNTGICESNPYP